MINIVIPHPTGACPGVTRALAFLPWLRKANPQARIFANHQPMHHQEADRVLKENRIAVLDYADFDILEKGDIVVGSAHGTPVAEIEKVKEKDAAFVDITCPPVESNNNLISADRDNIIVYIGKPGHREFEATASRARKDRCFVVGLKDKEGLDSAIKQIAELKETLPIVLIRQTTIPENDPDTQSIYRALNEALSFRFELRDRGECFATQNRQESLIRGMERYKPALVLVLTSANSSNGMALVRTAESYNKVKVIYAETAHELTKAVKQQPVLAETILLTAAASVIKKVIGDATEELCQYVQELKQSWSMEYSWLIERDEPEFNLPELS